jgi:hypothetical protein
VPTFRLQKDNEINMYGLRAAKVSVGFVIGNVADLTSSVGVTRMPRLSAQLHRGNGKRRAERGPRARRHAWTQCERRRSEKSRQARGTAHLSVPSRTKLTGFLARAAASFKTLNTR